MFNDLDKLLEQLEKQNGRGLVISKDQRRDIPEIGIVLQKCYLNKRECSFFILVCLH